MGTNESILLVKALMSFTFIQVIFRLNKSFLFMTIVLNLILVSVFGAKIVSLFGFVTNNGNVFYAAVFFATQLLIEVYGKKEAYRSIVLGVCSIVFFMLMAQLTILKIGEPQSAQTDWAITFLFQSTPRIAIASLVAYVLSQIVNISVFSYLAERTNGRQIFLRVNVANVIGQLVDSGLFFTIAFGGAVSATFFWELLLTGYVVKVGLGLLSTPFFYLHAEK